MYAINFPTLVLIVLEVIEIAKRYFDISSMGSPQRFITIIYTNKTLPLIIC